MNVTPASGNGYAGSQCDFPRNDDHWATHNLDAWFKLITEHRYDGYHSFSCFYLATLRLLLIDMHKVEMTKRTTGPRSKADGLRNVIRPYVVSPSRSISSTGKASQSCEDVSDPSAFSMTSCRSVLSGIVPKPTMSLLSRPVVPCGYQAPCRHDLRGAYVRSTGLHLNPIQSQIRQTVG